ncbi:RhuM family protein, partial [Proteus faecis]|uniref:RhuM family protein n=1 Tax=Proteus faecis TaxID=2050967 RepID=UPI003CF3FE2C
RIGRGFTAFFAKLDQFLSFNDREVLQGAGGMSKKAADEKAKEIFDIYAQKRRQLKEAEGARANITVLKDLLKRGR